MEGKYRELAYFTCLRWVLRGEGAEEEEEVSSLANEADGGGGGAGNTEGMNETAGEGGVAEGGGRTTS